MKQRSLERWMGDFGYNWRMFPNKMMGVVMKFTIYPKRTLTLRAQTIKESFSSAC